MQPLHISQHCEGVKWMSKGGYPCREVQCVNKHSLGSQTGCYRDVDDVDRWPFMKIMVEVQTMIFLNQWQAESENTKQPHQPDQMGKGEKNIPQSISMKEMCQTEVSDP